METASFCRQFLVAFVVVGIISSGTYLSSSESSASSIKISFYGPTFPDKYSSKNLCTREGCQRYLVTCKHKDEHRGKQCSYCPNCDIKCTSCPKDSSNCAICFDYHPTYEEVTLACNHSFGTSCLQDAMENGHSRCPLCRKDISFKQLKSCEFCHGKIFPFEDTCSYTCRYRRSDKYIIQFACEKHVCHERCMKSYIIKTAFLLEKGGAIYFRCPLVHAFGFYDQRERYIEAVPLVSDLKNDRNSIPVRGSTDNACDLCHRKIKSSEKEVEYECSYDRDYSLFGMGRKKHKYHRECLKSYAERSARRNLRGNMIFDCPADHNDAHDSTSSNSFQFEVKLSLFDFTPQRWEEELCPICEEPVKWDSPDAVPPIYFMDRNNGIAEYLSCHKKCYARYILTRGRVTIRAGLLGDSISLCCPVKGHKHQIPLIKEEHTEILGWVEKN